MATFLKIFVAFWVVSVCLLTQGRVFPDALEKSKRLSLLLNVLSALSILYLLNDVARDLLNAFSQVWRTSGASSLFPRPFGAGCQYLLFCFQLSWHTVVV